MIVNLVDRILQTYFDFCLYDSKYKISGMRQPNFQRYIQEKYGVLQNLVIHNFSGEIW